MFPMSRLIDRFAIVPKGLIVVSTMLSASVADAEQFSIKCMYMSAYFVTFDTDDARVVYERPTSRSMKGHIDQVTENGYRFHLLMVGEPRFDLSWDRTKSELTWIGIPDNKTRGTHVTTCEKTNLRPSLKEFDLIAPYD